MIFTTRRTRHYDFTLSIEDTILATSAPHAPNNKFERMQSKASTKEEEGSSASESEEDGDDNGWSPRS